VKRILGLAAIAFLVFFAVKQPTQAAAVVHHAGTALAAVGSSLATLVTSLAGGG
jgi:hypothetical protein